MEEKIENGGVVDGLDLIASPVVSRAVFDGPVGLNCSGGGR